MTHIKRSPGTEPVAPLDVPPWTSCDNFLYGFKGTPSARQAVPAPADSAQDRDELREFVRLREVSRQ